MEEDSIFMEEPPFVGVLWVLEVALFGSNMPLGPLGKEKKENLLPHQK